jgi:hypothetical protein
VAVLPQRAYPQDGTPPSDLQCGQSLHQSGKEFKTSWVRGNGTATYGNCRRSSPGRVPAGPVECVRACVPSTTVRISALRARVGRALRQEASWPCGRVVAQEENARAGRDSIPHGLDDLPVAVTGKRIGVRTCLAPNSAQMCSQIRSRAPYSHRLALELDLPLLVALEDSAREAPNEP